HRSGIRISSGVEQFYEPAIEFVCLIQPLRKYDGRTADKQRGRQCRGNTDPPVRAHDVLYSRIELQYRAHKATLHFDFAGSPTTTKGAQNRGLAWASDGAASIIASIACRRASACESFGSRRLARNVAIISLAVASSVTLQCETISERAPA